MRKLFAGALACGIVLTLSSRAVAQTTDPAVKQAAVKDDTPKAFVGVWVPVSCQYNGAEAFGEKDRETIRLSIENGLYKLYLLTDASKMEGVRVHAAKLTADEKAGTFELEVADSQLKKKGDKIHGIFAFNGDQMKLCYAPADKPRPTKFEAPKDSGTFNEVWTRHKKK